MLSRFSARAAAQIAQSRRPLSLDSGTPPSGHLVGPGGDHLRVKEVNITNDLNALIGRHPGAALVSVAIALFSLGAWAAGRLTHEITDDITGLRAELKETRAENRHLCAEIRAEQRAVNSRMDAVLAALLTERATKPPW